jgi:hypothetical protein
VNHLFLNRLATAPFSRQDYRVFAENHYPLVCVFTQYLEMLLVRAPDSGRPSSGSRRCWSTSTAKGARATTTPTMYGGSCSRLGATCRPQPWRVCPGPRSRFIREHQRIVCESSPFLVGLGAVGPGHEWAIPEDVRTPIIPGLRRAGFDGA